MTNILVTGGAGFIGSHSVDYLLQEGATVTVFDNLATGLKSNLPLDNKNLSFVEGDIRDFDAVKSLVTDADKILHLAAQVSVPASIDNPIESLSINTLGFMHILEAIRQTNSKKHLVFASSAAVYGDTTSLPCNDEVDLHTESLSPYAQEKIDNENYARLYQRLFGINSIALRYFNVYGPRQSADSPYSGVITKFINSYQRHGGVTVFGDGAQTRDFIHVIEVAKANMKALQSDFSSTFNIASGNPTSLIELTQAIETAGSQPIKISLKESRQGDIKESFAKIDKAKEQLKFISETSLSDGIKTLL